MTPPKISVVVPVYDTKPEHLVACLDSVLAQSYKNWELCLVDDASPGDECRRILDRYARRDARVRVIHRQVNGGIVEASNDAIAIASGDFVALLDHDDLLKPDALLMVAAELTDDDEIDYLYSDEEYLHPDETIEQIHKPEWSPELFRSYMFTCHLSVFRTTFLRSIGGFTAGYEGSQDYDLVLRVSEKARKIVHIPRILYTWRLHGASFSRDDATSASAYDAGRRAVQAHCDRVGIQAVVEDTDVLGLYRVRRAVRGEPLVSIIIPTRGTTSYLDGQYRVLVENCVTSIVRRSTYTNIEFVIVADTATPEDVLCRLRSLGGERLSILPYDRTFNFSDKCNQGVVASSGDIIVLLNDDTEILTNDWCEAMLSLAQEPAVGLVGCLLYLNNLRVQHAGLLFREHGPHHGDMNLPYGREHLARRVISQREVVGVTGAAVMMRRAVFDEVGGLSTDFPINFNDVDLGLKVRAFGYSVIYTPHARMYHFESLTRDPTVHEEEITLLRRRWWRELLRDPYAAETRQTRAATGGSAPPATGA